jgi:hypothetical protein
LLDGSCWAHPEADWPTRDKIAARHRKFIQGMLWFLGHDPRVPEPLRRETLSWGLNRKAFPDNGHWPWQLYPDFRNWRGILTILVVFPRWKP